LEYKEKLKVTYSFDLPGRGSGRGGPGRGGPGRGTSDRVGFGEAMQEEGAGDHTTIAMIPKIKEESNQTSHQ